MTTILHNLQKEEAISRLKMLKVMPQIIKEFENENTVYSSESGYLYFLSDEQEKIVKEFEEQHDAVVYHVIRSFTCFGELLALLYVSKHQDEWGYDREDLKEGEAIAYVKNLDDDICSEFGSIGVEERFGGLVRTF